MTITRGKMKTVAARRTATKQDATLLNNRKSRRVEQALQDEDRSIDRRLDRLEATMDGVSRLVQKILKKVLDDVG